MCGGSSPSGETKVNWNEDMAPRWNTLLNRGVWEVTNPDGSIKPREQYTNPDGTPKQRIAPLSWNQSVAGGNISSLNDLSKGTIDVGNAARNTALGTMQGKYLEGPDSNPYAGLDVPGMNPYIGGNPYEGQNSTTERNVFAGNSPYARDLLMQGLEDTTNAFDRGTRADTTRMMNLAGAFGGSAHQNKMANDNAVLAKTLSNQVNQFGQQQYDRSANLEESFLGRDLGAQQYNQNLGANLYENYLNRGNQNFNAGIDRGLQGWEGERGRMQQAIGYGQNEQGMALDRARAQMDFGALQRDVSQKGLDWEFDQWTQNQNHPYTSMDWLAGLFGKSVGSGGMNTSMYQGGGSQYAPYAGAALGLMSMFS